MKINKLQKVEYIISILLVVVMFLGTISVYASQKTDLTNEQNDIDKQIQETSSEIAGVKSQMTDALNQINTGFYVTISNHRKGSEYSRAAEKI